MTKVSIITPSYNQGKFIEATINSVLDQTYPNIEYIIIDGGSNDETMKIVEKYRPRLSHIIHENDKGQTDAINKGFKLASGELVGWINSDDVLYPNCVEEIVRIYQSSELKPAIVYSSKIDVIDEVGHYIRTRETEIKTKEDLLNRNYDVIQQGSFYKTALVKEIGYLDEKLHYCMDLDLWLRLLDRGPIASFHKGSLAGFRFWGDTKTSTGGIKFINEIYLTIKKHKAKVLTRNTRRIWYYKGIFLIKRILRKP